MWGEAILGFIVVFLVVKGIDKLRNWYIRSDSWVADAIVKTSAAATAASFARSALNAKRRRDRKYRK